jgi:hypothetical protein
MMQAVIIPYFKSNFVLPLSYYAGADECVISRNVNSFCMEDRDMQRQEFDMHDLREGRITPGNINHLAADEIFVFGSNLAGMHGGGAARAARLYFGAVMGQGVGLQGQSYAIPTMQGDADTIRPYVDGFIAFARQHPEKKFLVTRIGCGIAGFDAEDIAPLFRDAMQVSNISLPADFWDVLL